MTFLPLSHQLKLVLNLSNPEGCKANWYSWLGYILMWYTSPLTVTHPSANWAQHRICHWCDEQRYHHSRPPAKCISILDHQPNVSSSKMYIYMTKHTLSSWVLSSEICWRNELALFDRSAFVFISWFSQSSSWRCTTSRSAVRSFNVPAINNNQNHCQHSMSVTFTERSTKGHPEHTRW